MEQVEQRTEEWFKQRLGLFTSSEIYKLMGTPRSKSEVFTDTAKTYIMQKVAERLTGVRDETPTTKAMQWGIDNEPLAKEWVGKINGWEIHETSFVKHPTLNYGGSGDGWIREIDAAIEVKCLNTANHLQEVRYSVTSEDLKANYPNRYWQLTSDTYLRGCSAMVMCWFDPRLDNDFGLMIRKYEVSEIDINFMLEKIAAAEEEFNEQLNFFTKP